MKETEQGTIEWLLFRLENERELAQRIARLSAITRTNLQCHIAELMARAAESTADEEDKAAFEAKLGGPERAQLLCRIADILEGDMPFYY